MAKLKVITDEEREKMFNDKDNWFFVKSYRLSQAIAFLVDQEPVMFINDGWDKDKYPRLYFYRKTERFNEAIEILLDTKDRLKEKYANK